MRRFAYCLGLTLVVVLAIGQPAGAINLVWDDQGDSIDPNIWSDTGNWLPDDLPDSTDDLFIGVNAALANFALAANDVTIVDLNFNVNSITLGNGADIINSTDSGTTTTEIQVDTSVTVGNGTGTSVITLFDAPTGFQSLDTSTMTIGSGGQVVLDSDNGVGDLAVLQVDNGLLEINAGGTLRGNGLIQLQDLPLVATTLLDNDGTLTASAQSNLLNPPATTLQITSANDFARVDLDGSGGGNDGIVNVLRNATLDIDVMINDVFGGDINLGAGATLDIMGEWTLEAPGTLDVDTPGVFVGTGGPSAHLAGGTVTMTGGTITLNDGLDTLTLDAALITSGGTIENNGLIIVNSVSTVGAGTVFNMNGIDSSLTVNGTLNINRADFNLDGGGFAGNITTINELGILDLDVGVGADVGFDHTINMNGGELDVTSSAVTSWSLNSIGTINAAGGQTSNINSAGETFNILGAINVTANSTLVISSTSEFNAAAVVVIDAGSTLNMGTTTYNGGSYTGGGVLRPGTATIAAATTWGTGTVKLDDGPITMNANLTVNTNAIDTAGGFGGTITIADAAVLTVNIGGGGAWTVDAAGIINYNGNAAVNNYLAGSDITMNGTINHTGDGRTNARLDIGATGVVNILTAAEPFRLSGGTLVDPNTIAADLMNVGMINGPGILAADTATALHGAGTISADIDFDGTAELLADNGTLSLTAAAAIVDVNVIGTADADGILAVGAAWNTNVTDPVTGSVVMNGGQIIGAAITNDGVNGINGFGLLASPVNNNTRIDAEGGLLIVQTPGNNNEWDGLGNTGSLNAISGNLEVRDNAGFPFSGTVSAAAGTTVLSTGFELEFEPTSTLSLTGGTYRSTEATDIGGTVTIGAGTSTLGIGGTTIFENGSSTALNGDLQLANATTRINAGATFSGGGTLINMPGRTLTLVDGADVDVLLENRGALVLGLSAGQTTGLDFEQTAAGAWNVELGGTGINDYDRMTLTGLAQVDGTLNLSLLAPYVPTLADPLLTILTASSVSGTFDAVFQPAGMPAGLMFDVIYNAGNIQLDVVALLLGDYNRNGTVDAADHSVWRDTLGTAVTPFDGADGDGDGVVDNDDYGVWVANFGETAGSGSALGQSVVVPEPGAVVLALIAVFGAVFCGGRGRR